MLLLSCCYCFILVQILKTHHLDAKINKIWLFMMLGIDPTIHGLKKKKSKASQAGKSCTFCSSDDLLTPQTQFLPLSFWGVVRSNKKQNESSLLHL